MAQLIKDVLWAALIALIGVIGIVIPEKIQQWAISTDKRYPSKWDLKLITNWHAGPAFVTTTRLVGVIALLISILLGVPLLREIHLYQNH